MTVDGSRNKDDGSGNSWRSPAVPLALSAGNAEVGGADAERSRCFVREDPLSLLAHGG